MRGVIYERQPTVMLNYSGDDRVSAPWINAVWIVIDSELNRDRTRIGDGLAGYGYRTCVRMRHVTQLNDEPGASGERQPLSVGDDAAHVWAAHVLTRRSYLLKVIRLKSARSNDQQRKREKRAVQR